MHKVLVIDDDERELGASLDCLAGRYLVDASRSGSGALTALDSKRPDLVVLGFEAASADRSLSFLDRVVDHFSAPAVVCAVRDAPVELVVSCVKRGASAFVMKPVSREFLLPAMRSAALERFGAVVYRHPGRISARLEASPLLGDGKTMLELRARIDKFAASDLPVLLLGETGTGKELVARELHLRSRRGSGPFVPVNCAMIPDQLAESEFFGTEACAFTGASTRPGYFESATGGTLFLDEIAELGFASQAKLLRVLETRDASRLGSTRRYECDTRIVAATNADPYSGPDRFRPDLLQRLDVLVIETPPLRSRPEDVPLLATSFLVASIPGAHFDEDAIAKLSGYRWPGNVRELFNVVRRAAILAQGAATIGAELVDFGRRGRNTAHGQAMLW